MRKQFTVGYYVGSSMHTRHRAMKYDTTPPKTHVIALPDGATSITLTIATQTPEESRYDGAPERIAEAARKAPETLRPSDTLTGRTPNQVILDDLTGASTYIEPEAHVWRYEPTQEPRGTMRWTGENAADFVNWLADPRAPRLITGMPAGWHVDVTHAHGATLTLQYRGKPIVLLQGESLIISKGGEATVEMARKGAEQAAKPVEIPEEGRTYLDLVHDALRQLRSELSFIEDSKWTQAWHDLGELGQISQQQRRNILLAEIRGLEQVLDIAKAPPATDPNAEPGFITRMREELDQLTERYGRLRHFMGSEQATTLDDVDRALMGDQCRAMAQYQFALSRRLTLARAKHEEGKA